MKYFRIDLLTLLISLFILGACKNPDGIGLEVDPDYALNGVLTDTVTIRSHTVAEDTVSTIALAKYPLGYMQDPVFGTTEANVALSLILPNNNQTFGTSPVLDSAVLVLKYAGFYGDSLQSVYQVDVHQLQMKLDGNTSYSNRSTFNFNNAVIGSKAVRVSLKDSVKVTELVAGKPDVQKNKAPQIRIPISSSFITEKFLNSPAANFADNTAFSNFIKGLYITVNKSQSTGPGGVMFFDLSTDGASGLEIYYKSQNGSAVDTSMLNFKIQAGAVNPVAANFSHNYTGTPVETQLSNPDQQFETTYVQGLSGVRARITFPYLTKLKELGAITINKADLIVDVEGTASPFNPAPRLILYRTDIADQRQMVPDLSLSDPRSLMEGDFGGYFNKTTKRYTFSITSYIQDIIQGKLKQYDTFIAPVDFTADRSSAILPSATAAGRSILGAQGGATYKMKLNIIYTKTNK